MPKQMKKKEVNKFYPNLYSKIDSKDIKANYCLNHIPNQS